MQPVNRYLTRRVRQVLYMMKRLYGGPIDIYQYTSTSTDPETGDRVFTRQVHRVKRAAILNEKVARDAQRSISAISANKLMVMGGTYDTGRRVFIVDRQETPNLPSLSKDDWIAYNNRKYQIETFEEIEFNSGWIITGRWIVGERPEQSHQVSVVDLLEVTSTATQSP